MKDGENCFKSLKQIAYEKISSMILSGELRSDEELHEIALSEKLGISRTPLREAFQQLEKEGLIEVIPRKGAFLRKISVKDIQELFQVREAVEGMAARLAASKIGEEDLCRLEALFEKAGAELDSLEKSRKLEQIGDELHKVILQKCNNKRIIEILSQYKTILAYERMRAALIPIQVEDAFLDHIAILNGLRKGPDDAEASMRNHIRKTMISLIKSYY